MMRKSAKRFSLATNTSRFGRSRPIIQVATKISAVARRHRGRTLTKRDLHHHGVEPAPEFEPHIGMGPDHLESAFAMHADRSGIGGVADDSNHLPVAARLALPEQPLHQQQADAAAMD